MVVQAMHVCTNNGCRVEEEHVGRLVEIFEGYARLVAANEPGCLLLRVLQDASDPRSFLVFAEFADQAAYEAHLASAHVAQLREQIHPLIGDTHSKTIFKVLA